jgi:hypothetical protein
LDGIIIKIIKTVTFDPHLVEFELLELGLSRRAYALYPYAIHYCCYHKFQYKVQPVSGGDWEADGGCSGVFRE